MNLDEMEKALVKAREICERAHEGQTRWNGDPYFTHPERVVKNLHSKELYKRKENGALIKESSAKIAIVGYLHDVLEDCPDWNVNRLIDEGIPQELVWSILILTKLPGENYLPYILRVKNSGDKIALQVKKADIEDNLRDLHIYDKTNKMIDRYEMALYILQHNCAKCS